MRLLLASLFLAACVASAHAQTAFARIYRGEGEELPRAMALAEKSEVLLVSESVPLNGKRQMSLTKTSQLGDTLWTRRLALPQVDGLVRTGNGQFMLVGGVLENGRFATALLKLTSEGQVMWYKTLPNPDFAEPNQDRQHLFPAPDGGFYLIRRERYAVDADLALPKWKPFYDARWDGRDFATQIIKLDENGTFIWRKAFAHFPGAIINAVAPARAPGAFIVAGEHFHQTRGKRAAFLAVIDAQGGMKWGKSFSKGASYRATSVGITRDSGYVMSCNMLENNNLHLMKLNTDGTILWDKLLVGRATDRAAIHSLDDGSVVYMGIIAADGTAEPTSSQRHNVVLGKYAQDGSSLGEQDFGEAGHHHVPFGLAPVGSSGAFVVAAKATALQASGKPGSPALYVFRTAGINGAPMTAGDNPYDKVAAYMRTSEPDHTANNLIETRSGFVVRCPLKSVEVRAAPDRTVIRSNIPNELKAPDKDIVIWKEVNFNPRGEWTSTVTVVNDFDCEYLDPAQCKALAAARKYCKEMLNKKVAGAMRIHTRANGAFLILPTINGNYRFDAEGKIVGFVGMAEE